MWTESLSALSYALNARQTGTSSTVIGRTNWEFERCANVEILEFIYVYIVICQAEEGPMRVMYSYRLTIFVDDKTEVAGFETDPNEESMWSMLKRLFRYLVDA